MSGTADGESGALLGFAGGAGALGLLAGVVGGAGMSCARVGDGTVASYGVGTTIGTWGAPRVVTMAGPVT